MPSSPASSEQKNNAAGIASWLLLFVGLAPWFITEWQAGLGENVSWLLIGAQRLLHGEPMLRSFYDGDPPLNIMIYMPAVVTGDLLHLPVWRGLFLWMAGLTVFAVVLVWRLAGLVPGLDGDRRQVIAASFLVSATVLYHLLWGEREQFIYLFLFPLVMAQGMITAKISIPRTLKYAALIPGAAVALIKPHYLLIPATMLMYRAWKRKSVFSPVRDSDFIALLLVALTYLAVTLIFFHDYVFLILPDLVRYYIVRHHERQAVMGALPFAVIAGMALMSSALLELSREAQKRIRLPLAMVMLCLVPCIIQMKGFSYHYVPAAGFLAVAVSLLFQEIADRLKLSRAGALPGVAAALAFAYMLTIFPPQYPGNNEFAALPFPAYVRDHAKNGAFFVYMDNMGMVPQTALYTGLTDVSRFSCLWFLLPALLEKHDKAAFERFSGYMAEDFARGRPSLLMLERKGFIHEPGKNEFDFMTYFSKAPLLGPMLKHYRKIETKSFRTVDYFGDIPIGMSDTLIFDVYVPRP